ncbi:MAG: BlaI/MecI/CopY family transcriptional regulator [Saprospiraceae bacterium]|nr:BlaI/MecI/CopY family transcriptional regulator [Saprospiraceae bacterium]
MKELTKAEEQIMHILWKLEKAFVNDIVEKMPEPKPAYNTVSTIVRILERKGFVGYKAYGKTHEYFPLIQKEEYTSKFFNGFLKNYFDNSFQNMVSFFSKDKNLSTKEMEEIIKILESEVQKTKQDE